MMRFLSLNFLVDPKPVFPAINLGNIDVDVVYIEVGKIKKTFC